MSSFSCPHFDLHADSCLRLHDICVPGRPGCVLHKASVFATPWQERLEAKRQAARDEEQRQLSSSVMRMLRNRN